MKNKKGIIRQRVQIGTSSLVLIFTVLCLVIFSTLSLTSAKADYSLAIKNESNIKTYYSVDAKGEELKRDVNEEIMKLASQANSIETFKTLIKKAFGNAYDGDNNILTYKIDANSEQFLLIQLKLFDYEVIQEGKENYRVLSWLIKNKVDYEIDDDMPVWNGV